MRVERAIGEITAPTPSLNMRKSPQKQAELSNWKTPE
jgi:hypothetical protein